MWNPVTPSLKPNTLLTLTVSGFLSLGEMFHLGSNIDRRTFPAVQLCLLKLRLIVPSAQSLRLCYTFWLGSDGVTMPLNGSYNSECFLRVPAKIHSLFSVFSFVSPILLLYTLSCKSIPAYFNFIHLYVFCVSPLCCFSRLHCNRIFIVLISFHFLQYSHLFLSLMFYFYFTVFIFLKCAAFIFRSHHVSGCF